MRDVPGGLAGLGIGLGDRVSLYSHNCWPWVVGYALARIGAVVNPIDTLMGY
jgi:long-chain acyl-CoA synthetase